MVGLNLLKIRRAAHAFGEDLFGVATQKTRTIETVKVGSSRCHIFLPDSGGHWGELIGAFPIGAIANARDLNNPVIHVLSRDELPVTPSIEWARRWIDTHSVVPEVISYPYRIFIDKNTGSIYLFDSILERGVVCFRRSSEIDLRGMITPFRLMWSWIANCRMAAVVHASAVATEHGTILFAGAAGSGKSSMAINLGLVGNHLISDDCVWIQEGECYPVFDRAKIKKNSELSIKIEGQGIPLNWFETEGDSKAFFQVSKFNKTGHYATGIAHIFFPVIWPCVSDLKISEKDAFERLEHDSGREVFQNGARSKVIIAQICKEIPASIIWISPNSTDNIERVFSILQKDFHVKS